MKEKIEQFIKDNNLKFTKGRRNHDLVIICGYAQYLSEDNYETLAEVLKDNFVEDSELSSEFDRVWDYALDNSYGNWWRKAANRKEYTISLA